MSARNIIHPLAAVMLGTMLLAACNGAQPRSPGQPATAPATEQPALTEEPAPSVEPTILPGELGTEADLSLTDAEVAAAVAHLEDEGSFVAIIPATLGSEYWFTVTQAARQRAEDLDMPVEVLDPRGDADIQADMITDAVDRGAAVIIMGMIDLEAVRNALDYAERNGVYIVQVAGRQAADFGGVTISVEDQDLGAVAGNYAGELINAEFGGQANVIILDFPDAPSVVVRAYAIRTALLSVAPDATIEGNYLGGTTEFGLESTKTALLEHPDLNVVVSINDAGAYGAYQILSAAGRSRADTIIVGIDGEDQALQYIFDKTMYRGTVVTSPARTGEMAIDAAVKLLAGSTLPQNFYVPVQLVTGEGP